MASTAKGKKRPNSQSGGGTATPGSTAQAVVVPAPAPADPLDPRSRPLHAAAARGDLLFVQTAIHKGFDINNKNEDSETPLQVACRFGEHEVVEWLLSHGATDSGVILTTENEDVRRVVLEYYISAYGLIGKGGRNALERARRMAGKEDAALLLQCALDLDRMRTTRLYPYDSLNQDGRSLVLCLVGEVVLGLRPVPALPSSALLESCLYALFQGVRERVQSGSSAAAVDAAGGDLSRGLAWFATVIVRSCVTLYGRAVMDAMGLSPDDVLNAKCMCPACNYPMDDAGRALLVDMLARFVFGPSFWTKRSLWREANAIQRRSLWHHERVSTYLHFPVCIFTGHELFARGQKSAREMRRAAEKLCVLGLSGNYSVSEAYERGCPYVTQRDVKRVGSESLRSFVVGSSNLAATAGASPQSGLQAGQQPAVPAITVAPATGSTTGTPGSTTSAGSQATDMISNQMWLDKSCSPLNIPLGMQSLYTITSVQDLLDKTLIQTVKPSRLNPLADVSEPYAASNTLGALSALRFLQSDSGKTWLRSHWGELSEHTRRETLTTNTNALRQLLWAHPDWDVLIGADDLISPYCGTALVFNNSGTITLSPKIMGTGSSNGISLFKGDAAINLLLQGDPATLPAVDNALEWSSLSESECEQVVARLLEGAVLLLLRLNFVGAHLEQVKLMEAHRLQDELIEAEEAERLKAKEGSSKKKKKAKKKEKAKSSGAELSPGDDALEDLDTVDVDGVDVPFEETQSPAHHYSIADTDTAADDADDLSETKPISKAQKKKEKAKAKAEAEAIAKKKEAEERAEAKRLKKLKAQAAADATKAALKAREDEDARELERLDQAAAASADAQYEEVEPEEELTEEEVIAALRRRDPSTLNSKERRRLRKADEGVFMAAGALPFDAGPSVAGHGDVMGMAQGNVAHSGEWQMAKGQRPASSGGGPSNAAVTAAPMPTPGAAGTGSRAMTDMDEAEERALAYALRESIKDEEARKQRQASQSSLTSAVIATPPAYVPRLAGSTDPAAQTTQGGPEALQSRPVVLTADGRLTAYGARSLNLISRMDGVMFACTGNTFDECLQQRLFGLPRKDWASIVEPIVKDRTALFLFNFATRQLHGAFVAASNGGLDILPNAWKATHRSGFPAQVRVAHAVPFPPLPEKAFSSLLGNSRNKVSKLSADQVKSLCGLFVQHSMRIATATAHRLEMPPHLQQTYTNANINDQVLYSRTAPSAAATNAPWNVSRPPMAVAANVLTNSTNSGTWAPPPMMAKASSEHHPDIASSGGTYASGAAFGSLPGSSSTAPGSSPGDSPALLGSTDLKTTAKQFVPDTDLKSTAREFVPSFPMTSQPGPASQTAQSSVGFSDFFLDIAGTGAEPLSQPFSGLPDPSTTMPESTTPPSLDAVWLPPSPSDGDPATITSMLPQKSKSRSMLWGLGLNDVDGLDELLDDDDAAVLDEAIHSGETPASSAPLGMLSGAGGGLWGGFGGGLGGFGGIPASLSEPSWDKDHHPDDDGFLMESFATTLASADTLVTDEDDDHNESLQIHTAQVDLAAWDAVADGIGTTPTPTGVSARVAAAWGAGLLESAGTPDAVWGESKSSSLWEF